jgi:NitT/TauT family transport system substrate-binding protein
MTHKALLRFLSTLIILLAPLCQAWAQPLSLGILPVVDTLPLIVGQEEGLFKEAGIDLELVSFQSALERDAALQAGQLDGYFGDLLNSILLIQSGQDLRIVTTAYHTWPDQRMFGIVAAPGSDITTLAQLKGRAVAISRATVIEYLLEQMLKSQGMPVDHVVKQEIKKIPIRMQMVLGGQVPAALLPEPLLTLAESKGARVIADDRELNLAETVVALRQARLAADGDLAGRFTSAYRQAVERINRNPTAYKSLLTERTRFPKIIEDQFKMPRFPDVAAPSQKDVDDVQDWLTATGILKKRLPYGSVVLSE